MLTAEQQRLERQYHKTLWRRARRATLRMIRASEEFETQSDALDRWLDEMAELYPPGHRRHNPYLDPVGRAKIRKDNIALQDALAEWDLWARTVAALHGAMGVEKIAPSLLGTEDRRHVRPEPPSFRPT